MGAQTDKYQIVRQGPLGLRGIKWAFMWDLRTYPNAPSAMHAVMNGSSEWIVKNTILAEKTDLLRPRGPVMETHNQEQLRNELVQLTEKQIITLEKRTFGGVTEAELRKYERGRSESGSCSSNSNTLIRHHRMRRKPKLFLDPTCNC